MTFCPDLGGGTLDGINYSHLKRFSCLVILVLPLLSLPMIDGESREYNDTELNLKLNFISSSINNTSISGQSTDTSDSKNISSTVEKAVIIIFDRGYEDQFSNAKPILDKYGLKASFFIICSFVDGNGYYKLSNGTEQHHDFDNAMSWDQIRQLQEEGHDIESHGMEHRLLENLSPEGLDLEISGSKECLENQGLRLNFFQFPNNKGAHNSSILKMVSKYFEFGLSDHSKLMFLNCDGWVNHGFKTQSYKNQYDCRTYSDDGTPTRTNKYSIREWSHDRFHSKLNNKYPNFAPHGNEISDMMFTEFVRTVEAQTIYNNKAGKIVAIPILGYHVVDKSSTYDTSEKLFDREMKYLHDNGFNVLTLTDLGYNDKEHYFYIK